MNPAFYVVYPSSEKIRLLVNAIRVIAEENQRNRRDRERSSRHHPYHQVNNRDPRLNVSAYFLYVGIIVLTRNIFCHSTASELSCRQ